MNTILAKIQSSWKALMPLVAYLASELAHTKLDWQTPSGRYAALSTLVTMILVYSKANKTSPVADDRDARAAFYKAAIEGSVKS